MIKLRVLGEYWDDVIPCALTDVRSRRGEDKSLEFNKEKSKLGLGESYEQEYLKKVMRLNIKAKEK